MKVIILQRVIPSYRVAVFREICFNKNHDISLLIGDDLKESKGKNARDLSGIRHKKVRSKAVSILGRVFTRHIGLFSELRSSKPDVIVCEAESHFLGYLTAIIYSLFFSRKTKLILWCFYSLPGIDQERTKFHAMVKTISRNCFDGFISYTSFGKKYLLSKGISENKITVATNVCDTQLFIDKNRSLDITKEQAKKILGVEGKFVASYIGTVNEVKRPDVILDLAKRFDGKDFHFFLVGAGPLEGVLKKHVSDQKLTNINVTGRITDDLALYYRATDVVLIPGRGGIVISEAMCFGVPVILHQADGIEYDLVINGFSGSRLVSGSVESFEGELDALYKEPDCLGEMGKNARELIIDSFNTSTMAAAVISAIDSATRIDKTNSI
ncbi:MAG: glycosyltransferase family 4 protein [Bermanella sp.]